MWNNSEIRNQSKVCVVVVGAPTQTKAHCSRLPYCIIRFSLSSLAPGSFKSKVQRNQIHYFSRKVSPVGINHFIKAASPTSQSIFLYSKHLPERLLLQNTRHWPELKWGRSKFCCCSWCTHQSHREDSLCNPWRRNIKCRFPTNTNYFRLRKTTSSNHYRQYFTGDRFAVEQPWQIFQNLRMQHHRHPTL